MYVWVFVMTEQSVLAVTGANGYIGRAFCAEAVACGMAVRGITRSPCNLPAGVDNVIISGIDDSSNWQRAFIGCNVIIHLAARVHVMQDSAANPLEEFRIVNVQGTL